MIGGGIGAILFILLVIFVSTRPKVIDLNECRKIEIDGYDGVGNGNVYFLDLSKKIEGEFETMKNVLILSGSPRKGGNSDLLCDEFMRGAKESGNNVTKINVASKKIAPCHACYFCGEHGGECVYKDDMAEILQAMIDADVLVLASPVYFYSIDAQLKAVIDRTVARWLEVKNKEFYYIMTAADEDKSSMDTTLACFRGYADCVNGAKEMGVIYGTGVYEKGKVLNTPAMAEAYEMGKNV